MLELRGSISTPALQKASLIVMVNGTSPGRHRVFLLLVDAGNACYGDALDVVLVNAQVGTFNGDRDAALQWAVAWIYLTGEEDKVEHQYISERVPYNYMSYTRLCTLHYEAKR